MNKIIPFPGEKPDMNQMMLDGKPEWMLSARGVVLFYLASWKEDGNEKAHNGLRRYCEYITMRGTREEQARLLRRWTAWTSHRG